MRVLVFGLGTAGASKAAFHQWQGDYGIAPYSTPEESDLRYALWLDQVTLYGNAALSPFTDRTLEEYREAFPLRTSEALRSDDFPAFPFKRFSRSYVRESLVAGFLRSLKRTEARFRIRSRKLEVGSQVPMPISKLNVF